MALTNEELEQVATDAKLEALRQAEESAIRADADTAIQAIVDQRDADIAAIEVSLPE